MQRRIPKYSKHKASGQARVRIDGRTIYLGKYDSPDSHRKYDALIARWLSGEKPASPDAMTVCIQRYSDAILSRHFRSLLARFGLTPKSKRGLAAGNPLDAL